jgi:hypothetical protein
VVGRDAIVARLEGAAAMHAGFGGAAWRIRAVDSQPLGVVSWLASVGLGDCLCRHGSTAGS